VCLVILYDLQVELSGAVHPSKRHILVQEAAPRIIE